MVDKDWLWYYPDTVGVGLINLCEEAHRQTARYNKCVSSVYYTQTLALTGDTMKAIASSCLTLGGTHAPIAQARKVFAYWGEQSIMTYKDCPSLKVAGFGNSFYKEGIDPLWRPFEEYLMFYYPEAHERIAQLQGWMHKHYPSLLYPNASLFTGAMCELLQFREGTEEAFVVSTRLPVWVAMGVTK